MQIASSEAPKSAERPPSKRKNAALKKEIKAMELEFQNQELVGHYDSSFQTRIRELEVEMEERIADTVAVEKRSASRLNLMLKGQKWQELSDAAEC